MEMAGSSEAGCSAGRVWERNGSVGSWELRLKQPVFAAATSSALVWAEQSPLCCYRSRSGCELSVGARMPLLGPQ